MTDRYADLAPADLVLLCGVLGNITDEDGERLLGHCTRLCRSGGTVVWTRNRKAPDLVPRICGWLEQRGFERLWVSEPSITASVGAHRFTEEPRQLPSGQRMFEFIGYDTLWRT